MSLAAGIGMPYELLSGDHGRANDRTIRVAQNDYWCQLDSDAWPVIIPQFLKKLRKERIYTTILAGHVPLIKRSEALKTHWSTHAHAYIHPVQDVQANIAAVNAGFKSRAEVIRERRYDISEVDAEINSDALTSATEIVTEQHAEPTQKENPKTDNALDRIMKAFGGWYGAVVRAYKKTDRRA